MSLKIDEYLSSCGVISEMLLQQTKPEIQAADYSEKDGDSYISSIGSTDGPLPCENYNDILQVMRKAKAESSQSETSSEEAEQSENMLAASGTSSTGSSSESEDETTTEIVVIDGVTYLETTTVVNGVTSVERTVISEQNNENAEADNIGTEIDYADEAYYV